MLFDFCHLRRESLVGRKSILVAQVHSMSRLENDVSLFREDVFRWHHGVVSGMGAWQGVAMDSLRYH
jgi:hypothetical protein